MLPLTKKQEKEYKTQKHCRVRKLDGMFNKDQNYCKVRDQREIEEAPHSICNIRYQTPIEIYLVFHNGPNYDYHSIIRERDEEFSSQFDGLGEKTEKYTAFTVPIKKQNENGKTLTCKIKLIDVRFLSGSLASLFERLHKNKCKNCMSDTENMTVNDGLLIFKCAGRNKYCANEFDGDLAKRFSNTYNFCDRDLG